MTGLVDSASIVDLFQRTTLPTESTEERASLRSPYATAGDRLYSIGLQDGSFAPSLGWHVRGEMGGVWMHPIKLLDGFSHWHVDQPVHIRSVCQ